MRTEIKGIEWLLRGEPRPVQLEALARCYGGMQHREHKDAPICRRPMPYIGPARGFCYFMEMRLGKTNALLNEYLLLRQRHGVKRLFILAPNRYKDAWKTEAEAFGVKEEIHVFDSKRRQNAEEFIRHEGSILVSNYEALVSDANMQLFHRFVNEYTLVAADESVMIKNRRSFFFKRGLELAKKAQFVRILTGKPVVQGPHDLWSQLRFARQLDGWNYYAFRNTFCKMGGFKGKQVVGEQNIERLRELLATCSFIARRRDWGTNFMPDYEARHVGPMLPAQKKAYNEMKEDFITYLQQGTKITADQVITKHIKLQQISSGFVIDEDKMVHTLVEPAQLPKLVELLNALENEIQGKTIIICYYRHSLSVLMLALKQYYPAVLAGGDFMKKFALGTEQEKRRFNTDPQCRVLIGQIQAVKYGHQLMGTQDDPCLTIIYYENTYSLDDRAQSEQRNQGEGQQTGIHIIDLYSSEVERQIITALQRKESVSEKILGFYRS